LTACTLTTLFARSMPMVAISRMAASPEVMLNTSTSTFARPATLGWRQPISFVRGSEPPCVCFH
jgi:hypothetical protein